MKKERKSKGISGIPLFGSKMELQFRKLKLRENQEYEGVVRDVVVNKKKGTMWIFVELDEIKNQTFSLSPIKHRLSELPAHPCRT